MKAGLFLCAAVATVLSASPLAAQTGSVPADATQALAEIRRSQLEGNVPPDARFASILRRDVVAYLRANRVNGLSLTIDLLRPGPTQSGVSYPKYYLWVRSTGPHGAVTEGALRVEAVDRVRFVVTDFVRAQTIRADRTLLDRIFPAALIPLIVQRADAH